MYVARACVCKVFQIYAHIRTSAPSCHVPDKRHRKTRTRRTSAHDAISHLLRQVHMCCVCRILYCSVLQRVAACCSVLQRVVLSPTCSDRYTCVAVSCTVLQRVAACCSVLQRVILYCSALQLAISPTGTHVLQCVIVCCSVLQRVAACCSVLRYRPRAPTGTHVSQCRTLYCSVLQRVAACYTVLQCVAACV